MALQDESCLYMWVWVSESEREKEGEYKTDRKQERERGSPWGLINQACIERESPGGSCVGRQVSIALWGRGYGQTHQSSQTTHTHRDTGRAEITQRQNPFPPLVPHYHVTALCFIFGFVLNVKYCCDQIMRRNGNASRFCKQFTIDYSAAYCVSLCFPFSVKKKESNAGTLAHRVLWQWLPETTLA